MPLSFKGIVYVSLLVVVGWNFYTAYPSFLLLIEPAPVQKMYSRMINHQSEAVITESIASSIANFLHNTTPSIVVKILKPLQNAYTAEDRISYINKQNAALFIRLHCGEGVLPNPQVSIFAYGRDLFADTLVPLSALEFVPLEHAHRLAFKKTEACMRAVYNHLSEMGSTFTIELPTPQHLPLLSLKGLKIPALLIEISSYASCQEEKVGLLLGQALNNYFSKCGI